MQFIVKCLWYLARNAKSNFKSLFFRILKGSYFKSLGAKTKFYGRVRFGTVENNISVGNNCMIGDDVFFSAVKGASITIGDHCSINTGGHIVASRNIIISSGTHIGEFVSIRDQNHSFDDLDVPIHRQGFTDAPILIGENCWIGRGVIIIAGVTLGNGCVVGANSVVNRSFGPDSVIAGAPAKLIRKRGEKNNKTSS